MKYELKVEKSSVPVEVIKVSDCCTKKGTFIVPTCFRAFFEENTGLEIYMNYFPSVLNAIEKYGACEIEDIVNVVKGAIDDILDNPLNSKIIITCPEAGIKLGGYMLPADEENAYVFSVMFVFGIKKEVKDKLRCTGMKTYEIYVKVATSLEGFKGQIVEKLEEITNKVSELLNTDQLPTGQSAQEVEGVQYLVEYNPAEKVVTIVDVIG